MFEYGSKQTSKGLAFIDGTTTSNKCAVWTLKSLPQEIVCHSSAAGHRLLSSSSANSWQHWMLWLTTLLWLALSNRHVLHLKCFEAYNTRVACGLNFVANQSVTFWLCYISVYFRYWYDAHKIQSLTRRSEFLFLFLNKWMALLLQRTNIIMFLQM